MIQQLTPNSRFALSIASAMAVSGSLLYAGWFTNGMLRDIRDDIGALRSELRIAASDRWTGRDMRDYTAELIQLNSSAIKVPDVIKIQQDNRPLLHP